MPTHHLTDANGSRLLSFSYDGSPREALGELPRRIEHCDLMLGNTQVAKLQVDVAEVTGRACSRPVAGV